MTKYGMDQRSELLFISKIQLVDDTYYLKKPDKTLVPIDYNILSTYGRKRRGFPYDLMKFLVTAKVFEDTDRNPLGMYMLYKVKFPDGSMYIPDEDSTSGSQYSSYFDPTFYQTLVILNK
jgi:hypothetical protein